MNVVTKFKILNHGWVATEMGDDTQLDLGIVGGHQSVFRTTRHKGATDLTSVGGTHRNVLQVGIVGTQTSRGCHRLIERGVNQAVLGINQGGKCVEIGGFQLGVRTVFQNGIDDRMFPC